MSGQERYGVRCEWGPVGAAVLAPACAALVVVDVLSFSTSACVLVDRGTRVYPHPCHDSAESYARSVDAAVAVGRRATTAERPWSLSPAALVRAPYTPRLVLPSPNGSAIAAAALERGGRIIVAGCLRNADVVGRWLAARGLGTPEAAVAVIPAGERWPDGTLRPSLEDSLGAGAVIDALVRHAIPQSGAAPSLSPEASLVRAAFLGTRDVAAAVSASASGRELIDGGFAEDVIIAVENRHDGASVVPVLVDHAFTAVPV